MKKFWARRLLFRNFNLKIIALLLALLAWIYAQTLSNPSANEFGLGVKEKRIDLPIEYNNLPTDLQIIENTETVELVLSEGFRILFSSESLRAYVDLSQIETAGNYYLEINLELPQWMTLKQQQPKYARILIEKVDK